MDLKIGDDMEYKVNIENFSGPLDLLLHLIREMKVDIYEVKVSDIAEQYLQYIRSMEELHLEIASEYLVMAAQLIYIKSQTLLPKQKIDDEEFEYEESPEEQLRRRLIEYKVFKEISSELRELEEYRSTMIVKAPENVAEYLGIENKPELTMEAEIYDIIGAFNRVLRRQSLLKPIPKKIQKRAVTIEERIEDIKILVDDNENLLFTNLFEDDDSREFIVITFLAILELVKERLIFVTQDDLYCDIFITKNVGVNNE